MCANLSRFGHKISEGESPLWFKSLFAKIMFSFVEKTIMADSLSKEKRSKVMASIRSKNTKPEITIRKLLWNEGIRYRIHSKSVFGTPDISIKKQKLAVFIDGCFWHGCKKCYKEPKSNVDFWRAKLKRNKERRREVKKVLRNDEWNVLEFWEHEINNNPKKILEDILLSNKP